MNLEIDTLGTPLRKFEELRDELTAAGKKFDEETLTHVPYEQLVLCATGHAGAAMCPIALVQAEKECRRTRFITMTDPEFQQVQNLLRIEQMHEDTKKARRRHGSPSWEDLTPRQRVWFKLNCINNHIDNVTPRMEEAIQLLCLSGQTDLPSDVATHYVKQLDILRQIYPGKLAERTFRGKIATIAHNILAFLPAEEAKVCEEEVLYNYSCTSDCYRALL